MGLNNSRSARAAEPDAVTREQSERCHICGAIPESKKNETEVVSSSQTEDEVAYAVLSVSPTESRSESLLDGASLNEESLSEEGTVPVAQPQTRLIPVEYCEQLLTRRTLPYLQVLFDGSSLHKDPTAEALAQRKKKIYEGYCTEHMELVAGLDILLSNKHIRLHPLFRKKAKKVKKSGASAMGQGGDGGNFSTIELNEANEEIVKLVFEITRWLALQS